MPFPTNPTDGQQYTQDGTVYTFHFDTWYRTQVASDNDTNYSGGFSGLPSGGTLGQVLARSAGGGLTWQDAGGSVDLSALIARLEALEALHNDNNYLIL